MPQRVTRLLPKLYHNIKIVLKCSTVSIIKKFLYVLLNCILLFTSVEKYGYQASSFYKSHIR